MQKLIIANWKSNKTQESARQWIRGFTQFLGEHKRERPLPTIVVAPSFLLLGTVKGALGEQSLVQLGAQDVSSFPMGAYTGAVCAASLQDAGAAYVIIGHSERRKYFHETDQDVAAKVRQVVDAGLQPVLCIDEPYLKSQVAALEESLLQKCIVAYEPITAIGTGHGMDVGSVTTVVENIHQLFGATTQVLYGGSVTAANIGEYLLVTDGALVGGASLEVADFTALIAQV